MYDVIIAGAGPAGGTLASLIKGDVLVLEKDKEAPLKDSGLVSSHFREFVDDDALVDSYVNEMEAVSPSGNTFLLRSDRPYAMLLKRKRLSYHLRIRAKENTTVRYERVRGFRCEKGSVIVETSKGTHEAKMIVGCDGTLSDVRKSMGIAPPAMVPGLFARTRQKLKHDRIKVFFNKFFSPDFFSWIIPQENEYGVMAASRPRDHLNDFKKSLELPDGELHSSMIPMGTTCSYGERALLVGEACGQTKPLTGGGIIFGMRAATIAGRVINDAIARDRFGASFLSRYETEWKKELQWEINKQLLLRKIYRKMSNADIEKLFTAFGGDIEKINRFDYDRITSAWTKLPKRKMFVFALQNMHMIF
ncbi:MAG: NAD(P)/FAD-dependent oxidoreductase [Candidatus Aenigmarchaeota archaeon]|nr:NAD(P)/FAD-dependent oxidoreductase [Candidatus Aenigmarchaeota archaeon]